MKNIITVLLYIILVPCIILADGLLVSSNESYPGTLLRNKSTEITVNIKGLVSETIVYQEFTNEWDRPTDAVYSFPLPADARANLLLYWHNDTTYKAVLKVQQQSTSPGTGEGGIYAKINDYIGKNGIKILLKDIKPGDIQKVEIHYISILDYYKGEYTYNYPLNTGELITYPVDYINFTANVESKQIITGFDIPSHKGWKSISSTANSFKTNLTSSKTYLANDIILKYNTKADSTNIDFYSAFSDTMDSHFASFIFAPDEKEKSGTLNNEVIFLLGNSSRMTGAKLEQSILAIKEAINQLSPGDKFNIMLFNSYYSNWKDSLVVTSAANKNDAFTFLDNVKPYYGSYLQDALLAAIRQFTSSSSNNSILLFTDGRTYVDPKQILIMNEGRVGIFSIAIGDDIDRSRLELVSNLNYGSVTYFSEDNYTKDNVIRMFNKIKEPVAKYLELKFNKNDVKQTTNNNIQALFIGSYIYTAGRYTSPGSSELKLTCYNRSGKAEYPFNVNYSENKNQNKFVETLWAKEMIDNLECNIDVYGETTAQKDSMIQLSLRYNLRCRYTAYLADYKDIYTTSVTTKTDNLSVPQSYIAGNYPNPFNPTTMIRFYLSPSSVGKTKIIKIFNIIGQLVAVYDISGMSSGWLQFMFNGKDFSGNVLPSGLYIVSLQIDNQIVNSLKICLVK